MNEQFQAPVPVTNSKTEFSYKQKYYYFLKLETMHTVTIYQYVLCDVRLSNLNKRLLT